MRQNKWLFLLMWLAAMLTACTYPQTDYSALELDEDVSDSLRFVEQHHYTVNYNFSVVADSIPLIISPGDSGSVVVYKGDFLVVADILMHQQDSIDSVYIKVARDQETQGWVRESDLITGVVPDDPISEFIYMFSNIHLLWFLMFIGVVILFYLYRMSQRKPLQCVHFNDIDSPYPTYLCILIAISATSYGTIQHFVPNTWVHFYYHPTLNPFMLPFGMGCFIACVWGILLLLLAAIDEVVRHLSFEDALVYLVGLGAICVVCYIFFTLTIAFYVGYVFLLLYIIFAIQCRSKFWGYHCGVCGAKLTQRKSRCSQCGALNE